MPEAAASKTILLVDDDDNNLAMYRWLLERSGYRVITAASGTAALQIMRDGAPLHCVLVDYRMPPEDGGVVAATVKRDFPDIPVALFSDGSVPEEARRNADVFLIKGKSTELLVALARLMGL